MKNRIFVLLSVLALAACSNKHRSSKVDPLDNTQCLLSVQKDYPTGRVTPIPDQKYRFIVQTSDNYILYVETRDSETTDTTRTDTLFSPIDSSEHK